MWLLRSCLFHPSVPPKAWKHSLHVAHLASTSRHSARLCVPSRAVMFSSCPTTGRGISRGRDASTCCAAYTRPRQRRPLLDPCTNLATGAGMLRTLYLKARATARYADPQHALGAAISAYNTGSFRDGFTNGYVHKVLANMKAGIPKLSARALPTRGMRNSAVPAQLVASVTPRAAHATARESSLDVVFQ